MPLDSNGDLAVAELVFWAPALILSVFVTFRHGFGRQLGWFFIILLALARLISASCTIAYQQQTVPDTGLVVAAAITSTIGSSFLVQAVLGLLTRVTDGTPGLLRVPPRIMKWLHLMLLVGVILGIVGGVDLANGDSADKRDTGISLLKASVILFMVGHILIGLALVFVTFNMRMIAAGEKRLILACLLCWPLIFVRLLYGIISVFAQSELFNYYSPNIWVRAFMAVLEEFLAAGIIIGTGLLTQKISRADVQNNNASTEYQLDQPRVQDGAGKV